MNTLEQVHICIKESTEIYCRDNNYFITTEDISNKINISRTVVSRYLNQLTRKEELIKIITRPVLYFDKQIIEKHYSISFGERIEFLNVEEMLSQILALKKGQKENLIIGGNGSLADVIIKFETFLSSLRYENAIGLICGEKGTGKKFVSTQLFESACESNVFPKDMKIITYKCCDSENTEYDLLGDKERMGLIEKSNGNLLFISYAEELSKNTQEKLVSLIENKMVDFQHNSEKIKIGIILSTTYSPHEVFESNLYDILNVNLTLPTLSQRPLNELERITYKYLIQEESKFKKKISLNINTFEALYSHVYKNNIDGLIKAIGITTSNAAYGLDDQDNDIKIYLYHLPEEILIDHEIVDQPSDKQMLSLSEIGNGFLVNSIINYYNEILKEFDNYINNEGIVGNFIINVKKILNRYCDFIIFTKELSNQRVDSYISVLENIFDYVGEKDQVIIYSNYSYVIAKIIYKLTYLDDEIQSWELRNKNAVNNILEVFNKEMSNEYHVALKIVDKIYKFLDIRLDSVNVIFLTFSLYYYGSNLEEQKIHGFVIAHGYSTASSIVDSVNRLVDKHVLDPIDMPLDVQVDEIIKKIKTYITYYSRCEELILMVDMGSLEEIAGKITSNLNIRVGVINNISTKVALSVADGMMQKKSLECILSDTCNNVKFEFKIYENKKKPVILFTTETGIAATKRVIEVFKNSLPKKIDLQFIMCDVNQLISNGINDAIFNSYNILMITGTVEIEIENVPYIAIEDLVSFTDAEKINNIFRTYLTDAEIYNFNNNLIKNFSLGNIVQSLTILNAGVLIDYIEDATEKLQRSLQFPLQSRIKIRLYIHISSIVERLVTKQKLIEYPELLKFEEKQSEFIKVFKQSFLKLCEYYGIEIPNNEIAYLYEYIFFSKGTKYGE